jgi:hypothetical protein
VVLSVAEKRSVKLPTKLALIVCLLPCASVQVRSSVSLSLSLVTAGLVQSPSDGLIKSSSSPTHIVDLVMPETGATVMISQAPGLRFGTDSSAAEAAPAPRHATNMAATEMDNVCMRSSG